MKKIVYCCAIILFVTSTVIESADKSKKLVNSDEVCDSAKKSMAAINNMDSTSKLLAERNSKEKVNKPKLKVYFVSKARVEWRKSVPKKFACDTPLTEIAQWIEKETKKSNIQLMAYVTAQEKNEYGGFIEDNQRLRKVDMAKTLQDLPRCDDYRGVRCLVWSKKSNIK